MLTRAVQPWRTLRVPPLLAVSCSSNKHQQGNDRGAQGNRHPKRGETAPAYEIGTPLHVIAGNAELLRMDLQAQNLDTDIVEAIVRQTDRITGLVHQLLTFARAKNEVMGPFALHDPLSHTLRLLETRMSREDIRTTLEIPDHLPLLWGATAWLDPAAGSSFTVHASCSDVCDPDPFISASVDGALVDDGSLVDPGPGGTSTLTVTCEDTNGNMATAEDQATAQSELPEDPGDDDPDANHHAKKLRKRISKMWKKLFPWIHHQTHHDWWSKKTHHGPHGNQSKKSQTSMKSLKSLKWRR